jgi:alanyl-tRNA synthetase
MNYEDEVKYARKAFHRGGNFLVKIFTKPEKFLTSSECLYIFNTYGIKPRDLLLMAVSHGFEIDEEGFCKLLEEQREQFKNMKQC